MGNITIGFTGDLSFDEYTKDFYKEPKRIQPQVYEFLNSNDFNIINFESPITNYSKTLKKSLAHKCPPESILFVKKNIKNAILSLANNHMMDFGPKGLEETIKIANEENIKFIGAGENEDRATDYIILGDEIKVGVISFQYKDYFIAGKNEIGTAHEKHKKLIKRKIKELKKKVDWIVVCYHGGDEFIYTPMPYTRNKLKKYLRWGANIVVAHHPHTVQGYERFGKKMIFYSLGNFIFDTDFQRAQERTQYGELLKISFDKEKYEFSNLNVFLNRKNGIIKKGSKNPYFTDIKKGYRKAWKEEALRFSSINRAKRKLRRRNENYSINGLLIEKNECQNYLKFDELVKKYYFEGVDKPLKGKNRLVLLVLKIKRKINKLANVKYEKHIYITKAKMSKVGRKEKNAKTKKKV